MLAAPTGKAARNLTERTGIEARTIHGALGKIPDANFLDAVSWNHIGLVVVDEASRVWMEMLGGILLSMHNIYYLLNLMKQARQAIIEGRYGAFVNDWMNSPAAVDY